MAELAWLYQLEAGALAGALADQGTYTYENREELEEAWGSISIDGGQLLDSAILAYMGLDPNIVRLARPVQYQTDEGVKTAYQLGSLVTNNQVVADGIASFVNWDSFVATVLNACNYNIDGLELSRIGVQIASEILGETVTDTSNFYVLGELALDADDTMRSYVNENLIQGVLNGAAACDMLRGEVVDPEYEVDEAIDISTIGFPVNTRQDIGFHCDRAISLATVSMSAEEKQNEQMRVLLGAVSMLTQAAKSAHTYGDGLFLATANASVTWGSASIVLFTYKWNEWSGLEKVKITNAGSINFKPVSFKKVDSENWYDVTTYTNPIERSVHILHLVNGVPTVEGSGAGSAELFAGAGIVAAGVGLSSNIISQTVVGDDALSVQAIDEWPAEEESHDIDVLYPGWLDSSLPRAYLDPADDAGVNQRVTPIDMPGALDRAGAIDKPYADARAGAFEGVEALEGALAGTLADTLALIDTLTRVDVDSIAGAVPIDITSDPTPTPTPIVPVVPSISADRLYTVHKCSGSELNALGSYLWSNDFISLITNMFNTPIEAVIGLHTLFYGGSLPLGSSETIKLGAVSATGCTGTRVTSQYTTYDCGSVSIYEYYGNAEDYEPYSKAQIYLPFCGFKEININEIMNATVNVKYGIDIFTGACVAMITVTKDGVSQVLYTFDGNCAVQQPVTSADYSRIISGIISAGVGIATGGVGAAVGVAGGLIGSKISYQRSGGLSANTGACAPKTPYIIIRRPRAFDASYYQYYHGQPTNWTVTLGRCSGFTRVKDVHLDGIACTDDERQEIERLLKLGVMM